MTTARTAMFIVLSALFASSFAPLTPIAPLTPARIASAQTATETPASGLFVDWTTNTYVPALYAGKRLPTSGSRVNFWATLYSKGKVVDLLGYTFRWYTDTALLQSGKGLQTISFTAPAKAGQIVNLRVQAQDAAGNLFTGNTQVPVIAPRIAIFGNYPGGVAHAFPLAVAALPYFFNVSDPAALAFTWSANGVRSTGGESPDRASIAVSNPTPGMNIRIDLTVANTADSATANTHTTFTYQGGNE